MISVVLPAHKEANLLADAVPGAIDGMRQKSKPFKVLIVENGSTDESTGLIAQRLADEVAEVRAIGLDEPDYWRTLRHGLLATSPCRDSDSTSQRAAG
jgi:glycosyltransferase involved in cell wall biosynthesis